MVLRNQERQKLESSRITAPHLLGLYLKLYALPASPSRKTMRPIQSLFCSLCIQTFVIETLNIMYTNLYKPDCDKS